MGVAGINAALVPGLVAARNASLYAGWIDNDVHYYLDTQDDLGLIYEIGNGGRIAPPERRFPADS